MSSTDTVIDKNDHRSQKDRMLAGDLCIAEDAQLQAASPRAYRLDPTCNC
ncbi:hypothetical protein K6V71_23895 [Cupriavidus gilardii]|nr:hypothetical protein [Cupriavidus gilardii]UXC34887.1 hypothetical protein N4G38_10650 [Cupriavidus gilardii]